MRLEVTFDAIGDGGCTRMRILTRFEDLEQLEKVAAMGMIEGMTGALGQIDAILNTYTAHRSDADIVYDVVGAGPVAGDRPPLVMIGQPMDASGFRTLVSYFPERVVVTYDPRGLGRSVRNDGDVMNSPVVQAEDVHTVITALGYGPVDLFASSGGAATAFALVAAYPHDVVTLVAHEPPLPGALPDGAAAERALGRS